MKPWLLPVLVLVAAAGCGPAMSDCVCNVSTLMGPRDFTCGTAMCIGGDSYACTCSSSCTGSERLSHGEPLETASERPGARCGMSANQGKKKDEAGSGALGPERTELQHGWMSTWARSGRRWAETEFATRPHLRLLERFTTRKPPHPNYPFTEAARVP